MAGVDNAIVCSACRMYMAGLVYLTPLLCAVCCTVFISRTDYVPSASSTATDDDAVPTSSVAGGGLITISFDLAISPRSHAFNSSTAFSLVLFKLDSPAWGFRSALAK